MSGSDRRIDPENIRDAMKRHRRDNGILTYNIDDIEMHIEGIKIINEYSSCNIEMSQLENIRPYLEFIHALEKMSGSELLVNFPLHSTYGTFFGPYGHKGLTYTLEYSYIIAFLLGCKDFIGAHKCVYHSPSNVTKDDDPQPLTWYEVMSAIVEYINKEMNINDASVNPYPDYMNYPEDKVNKNVCKEISLLGKNSFKCMKGYDGEEYCLKFEEAPNESEGRYKTFQDCQKNCSPEIHYKCEGNGCTQTTDNVDQINVFATKEECVYKCMNKPQPSTLLESFLGHDQMYNHDKKINKYMVLIVIATLLFVILSSKIVYFLTNSLFGITTDQNGSPTEAGILLHAIVFFGILYAVYKLIKKHKKHVSFNLLKGNDCREGNLCSDNTFCDCPDEYCKFNDKGEGLCVKV